MFPFLLPFRFDFRSFFGFRVIFPFPFPSSFPLPFPFYVFVSVSIPLRFTFCFSSFFCFCFSSFFCFRFRFRFRFRLCCRRCLNATVAPRFNAMIVFLLCKMSLCRVLQVTNEMRGIKFVPDGKRLLLGWKLGTNKEVSEREKTHALPIKKRVKQIFPNFVCPKLSLF